jgi:hypothetical protein
VFAFELADFQRCRRSLQGFGHRAKEFLGLSEGELRQAGEIFQLFQRGVGGRLAHPVMIVNLSSAGQF